MKYRNLGNTDIQVSVIGLGTMTWGHQNSEADAHAQLDFALSRGVNLIDTAEMYPTPSRGETWGSTERYIGSWLAKTKRRQDIVLASKIVGPPRQAQSRHIRNGETRHDAKNLIAALDGSLDRLQTDYLDLYQLHWPDRSTNFFGQRDYPWTVDEESVAIEETLAVLGELVKAGKIRHIGVSNETPWGVAQFLKHAERLGLPRIVSIQNPYSLLNRLYEVGLAEFSHRENVGLLAYSPLAFGVLSGKYLNGAQPEGARLSAGSAYGRFARYGSAEAEQAVAEYVALARQHELSPAQLALAFVASRPFVTSALSGATSLAQLDENLASLELQLTPELVTALNAIHARLPTPSPELQGARAMSIPDGAVLSGVPLSLAGRPRAWPWLASLRILARHPGLALAGLFVGLLVLAALAPGWLIAGDPLEASARNAFLAPSAAHWLGTDENGRDVLVRLVHGAGASLLMGLAATAIGLLAGIALGLLAGLGGRWLDGAIMRGVDVLLAFPDLLLALVIITFWGQGTLNAIIAVGIAGVPRYARLVRAQTKVVRGSAYVEAALTLGIPRPLVILRHVLPNAIKPILILATIGIGGNIAAGASLSFLGFGAPPPSPEWGSMLSVGRNFLANAWWLVAAPGVAVTLTVLAITALGRALLRYSEGKGA